MATPNPPNQPCSACASHEQDKSALEKRISDLEVQIATYNQNFSAFINNSFKITEATHNEHITILTNTITNLNHSISHLNDKSARQEETYKSIRDTHTELNETIANLNNSISHINEKSAQQEEMYKSILADHTEQITELKGVIEKLTAAHQGTTYTGYPAQGTSYTSALIVPSFSGVSNSNEISRPVPAAGVAVLCKKGLLEYLVPELTSRFKESSFDGYPVDLSLSTTEVLPTLPSASTKVIACTVATTLRAFNLVSLENTVKKLSEKGLQVFVLFLVYGSDVPATRKLSCPYGDLPYQRLAHDAPPNFTFTKECNSALEGFLVVSAKTQQKEILLEMSEPQELSSEKKARYNCFSYSYSY